VTGITNKLLILFIMPLFLYVGLLPVAPLMEPDEGRYSLISSSMNISGDYITPRLKEAVFIDKPPLVYWATALSFKIFGENEFSSRLFAGLCAWGCILLVYNMGRFLQDEKAGLYGAAVLTTSLFHFAIGRINIMDMPVAFFLSLAIWSGYRYCAAAGRKEWLYLCYLASALAFLAKGLMGIIFPAAIIIIWLVSVSRWRDIPKLVSPLGILIFLAVSLPWLILIQQAHSDFFRFFFVQEQFLRYATTIHNRYQPVYFYLPIIIAGTLPWCAFLYKALCRESLGYNNGGQVSVWSKFPWFRKEDAIYLMIWAGFITLFFSLSSSKLIPYIAAIFLPLSLFQGSIFRLYDKQQEDLISSSAISRYDLPVIFQSLLFIIALVAAPYFDKSRPLTLWWPWIVAPVIMQILIVFLPGYVRRRTGGNWFVTVYIITAIFLGAAVFPFSQFLTPYKSAYILVQAVKKYVPVGQELYQYDMSLYGVDFYGKIRTPIVNELREVRYGSEFLPSAEKAHYFLNSEEFFKLAGQQPVTYCATKGQEGIERLRKEFPNLAVMWDNKYYYLVRLPS
jgi:4-amino-4-deoxy-L-arabinose transferase-like glycosyltransferase